MPCTSSAKQQSTAPMASASVHIWSSARRWTQTNAVEGNWEHSFFSSAMLMSSRVHHRKGNAQTPHGGADFFAGLGNCEIAELFTHRCSQALGGDCISVS